MYSKIKIDWIEIKKNIRIFEITYQEDVEDRLEPLDPFDSVLCSLVMGVVTVFFSVSETAIGVLDQSRLSLHNC